MFRVFHYDILTFTLRRIKAIIGSNHASLMKPQTSSKIIGTNTEYTQNNLIDLDKILKDRSGSLKIFGEIIEDPCRSLVRLTKIAKTLTRSSKDLLK